MATPFDWGSAKLVGKTTKGADHHEEGSGETVRVRRSGRGTREG